MSIKRAKPIKTPHFIYSINYKTGEIIKTLNAPTYGPALESYRSREAAQRIYDIYKIKNSK
jgi:hypothetical protein